MFIDIDVSTKHMAISVFIYHYLGIFPLVQPNEDIKNMQNRFYIKLHIIYKKVLVLA